MKCLVGVKANIHQATLLLATVDSNNATSWRQQCCPVYGSDFAMFRVASKYVATFRPLLYSWQQLQATMLPSVCRPLVAIGFIDLNLKGTAQCIITMYGCLVTLCAYAQQLG